MSREAYSREEIEGKKREIIESDDDKNCPKPPLPELGEHSNYIFISYPHKDYKQVYCDLWDYYAEGVRYWYDRSLTAGVDWEKEVRQKITDARCSGIVYYLSENSFTDSMAFEISCAQEVAPDDSYGKSGRNYFSINLGGRQVMDLLFESQTKGLIKTSQDKVAIIFSTFPEKCTFIGRSKDPSDKKHMSAVIEQFRDRFSVVDSAESEAPKRGAAPESETFEIKKRQNGSYAVVALKDKSEMTVFVPEGVEDIGEGAFGGSDVIEVTLPEGLIKIGKRAFADCESLEKINFPSTLRIISDEAFSGCTSLDVDLPENIKVGADAFKGTLQKNEEHGKLESTEGLTFKLNNKEDGYIVNRYEGKSQTVVIPNMYNGLPVVGIGDNAFIECTSLESVTIPDSVMSIGGSAFDGCSSLASITIPDGVTSIGEAAFDGCSGLKSVAIPDGVAGICDWTFGSCSNLESITIPDSVTSIGDWAFKGCSRLKSLTALNGVTSIGANAFYECSSLTSITIPSGVTSIGYGAFYRCSSLESVIIPDSVTSIGEYAFYECLNLDVNLPKNIKIESSALKGTIWEKKELLKIKYSGGLTFELNDEEDGYIVKEYKGKSQTVVIPKMCDDLPVVGIGDNAFSECSNLKSIVIPDNVMSICKLAFNGCSSLESVMLPDSITSIGDAAFSWCLSLKSVTMPGSVTSIGDGAFLICQDLKSVTIPDSVASIGEYAFYKCSSLENITYNGTKQTWESIKKEKGWNSGIPYCTIHCTDGDIIINNNG